MFNNYLKNFKNIIQNLIISDSSGKEIPKEKAFQNVKSIIENIKNISNTLYLVGNGGSNGIVSHTSVDFLNSCNIKTIPLTDSSNITCFANDYGYENVFSTPLGLLLDEGDGLIAISSSGSSQNIMNAVEKANELSCDVITFSGFSRNNRLRELGDINFWLNSTSYGFVEIGHAFILHYITDMFSIL